MVDQRIVSLFKKASSASSPKISWTTPWLSQRLKLASQIRAIKSKPTMYRLLTTKPKSPPLKLTLQQILQVLLRSQHLFRRKLSQLLLQRHQLPIHQLQQRLLQRRLLFRNLLLRPIHRLMPQPRHRLLTLQPARLPLQQPPRHKPKIRSLPWRELPMLLLKPRQLDLQTHQSSQKSRNSPLFKLKWNKTWLPSRPRETLKTKHSKTRVTTPPVSSKA